MPFKVLWGDEPTAPAARQVPRKRNKQTLSNIELSLPGILPDTPKPSKRVTKPKKQKERGCAVCPLNEVKGIRKIFPKITGKDILIIAQSPGPNENEEGKELIGPAGEWWWTELSRIGIKRPAVDVMSALKCFPADATKGTYSTYLKMRNPSAEELRCCSIHTEEAFKAVKAKHILVLGQLAAKALLKTRSLPQHKIFWSDEFQAMIYLLDHPAFFIRGYGRGPRLDSFRQTLDQLVINLKRTSSTLADRFGYVKEQDYRLVLTKKQALAAKAELEKYRGKRRIGTDIEDAEFGESRRIFACGFSPKAGQSFVFVFKHRDQRSSDGDAVREIAISLLSDETYEFAYQYGCTDTTKWLEYEGVRVGGFTHDTQLSEYLRFSDKKAYGLEATAESRFPEFSGYKYIISSDLLAGVTFDDAKKQKAYDKVLTADVYTQYKFIEKHKLFDLSKLSLDTLRLYNGADCDLTKRIEAGNKKEISQSLMQLYIDLSYLLHRMEPNGPLFDYEQYEKLQKVYPWKERRLKRKLNRILGRDWRDKKTCYNPGSPQQVYKALYEELGLEYPYEGEEPNTRKRPLTLLARDHKFPKYQLEWRGLARVASTNKSYKACADNNGGRLRTKWWATGTRTGRLSSGGSKKKKDEGDIKVVNLQNIKKNNDIQNMCVADLRWKQFYAAAKKLAKLYKDDKSLGDALVKWVRENIPDLKTYLIHDYGQLEVRVMAQMCGDKNLKKDCMESDIHTRVGVTMTGWNPDKIRNDEQTRTLTKNVHFGIMFGLQDEALYEFVIAMSPIGQQGNITKDQVFEGYRKYFERYPGVKKFHNEMRAFAREHSYVETLFGMKQHLRIDDSRGQDIEEFYEENNKERGSYWANQAVNGPVQGTAHQMMICALVNLVRYVKKYKSLGIPTMEIHDALYFVVNVLELVETYVLSKELLEKKSLETAKRDFGIDWDVPIVTEAKAGIRLGTKVKLKDGFTVGQFLVDWYKECKRQMIALNKELKLVPESKVA